MPTQDEFRSHHPAPGVADDVECVLDAEFRDEVLELVQEEVDRPERRLLLLQVGGASVTELIVEDDRDR